jgi:hypothetical protein
MSEKTRIYEFCDVLPAFSKEVSENVGDLWINEGVSGGKVRRDSCFLPLCQHFVERQERKTQNKRIFAA